MWRTYPTKKSVRLHGAKKKEESSPRKRKENNQLELLNLDLKENIHGLQSISIWTRQYMPQSFATYPNQLALSQGAACACREANIRMKLHGQGVSRLTCPSIHILVGRSSALICYLLNTCIDEGQHSGQRATGVKIGAADFEHRGNLEAIGSTGKGVYLFPPDCKGIESHWKTRCAVYSLIFAAKNQHPINIYNSLSVSNLIR
jgi:hypothetical protein